MQLNHFFNFCIGFYFFTEKVVWLHDTLPFHMYVAMHKSKTKPMTAMQNIAIISK